MTRELALEASRRLNDIEDFESFMGDVDKIVFDFEGFVDPAFLTKLTIFMDTELARLNKNLADLKGE